MGRWTTPWVILATVACAAIANAQASPPAQGPPAKPSAHPFVVSDQNSGQPIAGAEVRDSASGKTAATNAQGTVLLDFVTPLRPRFPFAGVTVRKVGYKPLTLLVPMTDTTTLTGEMEPAPLPQLPAVVATQPYRLDLDPGKWEGFGARCSLKHVSCFNDTTLAAHQSYRLYDMLIKTDGVIPTCSQPRAGRRGRSSGTTTCIAQMYSATGGKCTPNYFVDGAEWFPPTRNGNVEAQLETSFGPAQLKGIEIYESAQPRPLQFTGSHPDCGAVVIWSK